MKLTSFFICLCCFISPSPSSADSVEQRLQDSLFKNYNPAVRPSNPNTTVVVTLSLAIQSLVDVKDKEGSITIAGWVSMNWHDAFLSWNPAVYGNISSIVIPAEKVWRPDVAFDSTLGKRFFEAKDLPIMITFDGTVDYAPDGLSTHYCHFDTTLFPFDTQTCDIIVAPWFSDANKLVLKNLSLEYFGTNTNEVWDVIGNQTQIDEYYNNSVVFKLTIKRKPRYYLTYILLPLVMMAVLNLSVFWLPPHSGEKLSLSITVLLSLYVLLITINDLLPVSSDTTPLLTICTCCLIFISTLSTMVTVFVVRLHQYKYRPVPPWVIKFLRLGKQNQRNKHLAAPRQEPPLSESLSESLSMPLPTWQQVSTAVDKLSFFVFLTVECLITLSIAILYAA